MRYQRNSAVNEFDLDETLFLVEPVSEEIYYLDAVSAGLWRLLEEPHSDGEIRDVFAQAFPDADPAQIDQDVKTALADMAARDLIGEIG